MRRTLLVRPDRAVAWCTMTSGSAATTAALVRLASSRSSTTGRTPCSRRAATFAFDLVVAYTSCPVDTSSGRSCRPTTPVAPATNTRTMTPLVDCDALYDADDVLPVTARGIAVVTVRVD